MKYIDVWCPDRGDWELGIYDDIDDVWFCHRCYATDHEMAIDTGDQFVWEDELIP